MKELAENQCPRCGEGIPSNERRGEYIGALSRTDNKTEICSACATDEGMTDLAGGTLSKDDWWVNDNG